MAIKGIFRMTLPPLAVLLATACFFPTPILARDEPEMHADIQMHFKYGSIGAEDRAGVPYWIWLVLPELFPEYLPDRPGKGYGRLGFIYESDSQKRPIGTSYREKQIPLVGLNCAACHTGRIREAPGAPSQIILGMPAHQFDLQKYLQFFTACAKDERFNAAILLAAIRRVNPQFSWFDRLLYRFFVIPRTKKALLKQGQDFSWLDRRPPQGPGRVDTFNPYKMMFGFDMQADNSVGTADLPSLWNQKIRQGMWLHWDGNNNKVEERNKSAAIGAGASEKSLDLPAMKRVEEWIWELKPPKFPDDKIKRARAEKGKKIYEQHCATCHGIDGKWVGQVIEIEKIGTDPERLNSFTAALAERMDTLGTGYPWKFSHFRKTNGYASMPLDGLWLRAPYLHNGSVPTLRDLLKPPEDRPQVFFRGYDVYDFLNVGFVSAGPEAERLGFKYDTRTRGNGNRGHTYGTDLPLEKKEDLLEYLKTL